MDCVNWYKVNGMLVADKHKNDRLHIGTAIENNCDIIVSMNFKHLVSSSFVQPSIIVDI